MTDVEPVLVTVKQAAQMLACTPATVYELAAAGTLTKRYLKKDGRNFRLSAEQVREYAANLPTTTTATAS